MDDAVRVDFDTVAAELYSLPPEEFTAARTAREKGAKAAGDPGLAGEIHNLTKPNAVGWLVNQLVRRHPAEIQPLIELGDDLREATAAGSGDRLRELSGMQRRLISALVEEARQLARDEERAVSADTARGVADTLRAALADASAARQLLAGRLTGELYRSGLADDPEVQTTRPAPAGSHTSASDPPTISPRSTGTRSPRSQPASASKAAAGTAAAPAAAAGTAAAPGADASEAASRAPAHRDAADRNGTGSDADRTDAAGPESAAPTRGKLRRARAEQDRASQLVAAAADARQRAEDAVEQAERADTDANERVVSLQTELTTAQAAQSDAERDLRKARDELQTAKRVEREAARRSAAVRTS